MQIGSIYFYSESEHLKGQWGFLQLHLSVNVRLFIQGKAILASRDLQPLPQLLNFNSL